MKSPVLVTAVIVGLAACNGDIDPIDTNETLDAVIGAIQHGSANEASCGNITLALSDVHDKHALWVHSELASNDQAFEVGYVALVDLADHPEALTLQVGKRLTIDACDDIIEAGNEADVDDEAMPVSGTIRIEVISIIDDSPDFPTYNANVSLEDVKFNAADASTDADLGTYFFGWLPG